MWPEGFGGLGGIGPDVVGVAVGQVHHQVVGLAQYPIDDPLGFSEVGLSLPRGMRQGHKHLLAGGAMLTHVIFDDGVLAAEPVLLLEPLEYPLGSVSLLLGSGLVRLEDLVNDAGVGV